MTLDTVVYLALFAGAFLLMMRFGSGAHVMGHSHHHGAADQDQVPAGGGRSLPPEKDIDPVCGMAVQTAAAKSAAYQGHVYYFCSQNCRGRFEASPASYVKPATTSSDEEEHHHGCC